MRLFAILASKVSEFIRVLPKTDLVSSKSCIVFDLREPFSELSRMSGARNQVSSEKALPLVKVQKRDFIHFSSIEVLLARRILLYAQGFPQRENAEVGLLNRHLKLEHNDCRRFGTVEIGWFFLSKHAVPTVRDLCRTPASDFPKGPPDFPKTVAWRASTAPVDEYCSRVTTV